MNSTPKDTLLVICQTVLFEYSLLIPEGMPIHVIPFEKHSRPEEMRGYLQEIIDTASGDICRIIFGIGLCSNSVVGLTSADKELVFPRVHDCIGLFFGSHREFTVAAGEEIGTLYLTKGFIESDEGQCHLLEYPAYKKRYGDARAREYMQMILVHYRRVMLLNTGAYNLEKCRQISRDFAEEFSLDFEERSVGGSLFQRMLQGELSEDVILLSPGETLELERFF